MCSPGARGRPAPVAGPKKEKQKTKAIDNDNNPEWDEDLAYDEKQDQWNKDYEYYSQSCPNGYKRENESQRKHHTHNTRTQ